MKQRTTEKVESDCKENKKPSFWQSKIFLGIITVFAVLMMALPYYGSVFNPGNKKKAVIVQQKDIQTLNLDVEGMTCSVCNSHVENAAYQVNGVIKAKADYRTGKAVVKFDKTKTSVEKIIKSINATNYYKVVGDTLE